MSMIDDEYSWFNNYYENFEYQVDEIEIDEEFLDTENMEMINKKYYIGSYLYIPEEKILLFDNKIHPLTFMKYKSYGIERYLFEVSFVPLHKRRLPSIEILQLHILEDDTYTVVVKTFWIKIIQRAWKKVYKERKQFIQSIKSLNNIRRKEFGIINTRFPGLYGLLHNYNTM
jgi:hypothetical protein